MYRVEGQPWGHQDDWVTPTCAKRTQRWILRSVSPMDSLIWGFLGVVPHELDALFHGQSQSQMDDWGYPYDLGNLHIVPKALKSLDQNHTIPKTLRLDPKVFLFVVIDKVVITV